MKLTLPVIVVSQFFCTTLWFAGNSIIQNIVTELNLGNYFLAHVTSSIQLGFITGTLVFAILAISDRFSPSRVFFVCSILAGLFNIGITISDITANEILLCRFLTGFFLAGIYPVGMKIASDYYQTGLGKSLGFLVGALVVGTAFPHLLRNYLINFPWKYVLYATTILSFVGGLCIVKFVPNGPYRKQGQKIKLTAFISGFKNQRFRLVSFGYFGHMWELYTFWAFVPVMLAAYNSYYPQTNLNVPLLSFCVIGSGAIACSFAGVLSQYFGVKKIAALALTVSCICCVVSPLFLFAKSLLLFVTFLFIWGLSVIADSPLFSTLVAQNAPAESRGTLLTVVNSIGFSITIVSIQFTNFISDKVSTRYVYTFLAFGPALGLIALSRYKATE